MECESMEPTMQDTFQFSMTDRRTILDSDLANSITISYWTIPQSQSHCGWTEDQVAQVSKVYSMRLDHSTSSTIRPNWRITIMLGHRSQTCSSWSLRSTLVSVMGQGIITRVMPAQLDLISELSKNSSTDLRGLETMNFILQESHMQASTSQL